MEDHPLFAELLATPAPSRPVIKRQVRVVNKVDGDGNSTIIFVDRTPGAHALAQAVDMVASGAIPMKPVTRGADHLVWFISSGDGGDDDRKTAAQAKVALLRELRRV
ncbi:hypothetical protein [Medusavirus stheno T3]|uniref:Uncharacterized protein n=1 Tax=Medusavirus stheno T3 TaxID=3069717 RepID=A0A7S8BEK0_9VIRU|nr:hypothetical protein QKU73_gp002 [Acanthamoeba castellanii medusavirus]QPB44183.1 hypothetical protein [Medusavirus stheno T3]